MRLFVLLLKGFSIITGLISILMIGFGLQECSGDDCMIRILFILGSILLLFSGFVYYIASLRLKRYV